MRMVKVKAHVFVSGRVQGVFFRMETRHRAIRRNVSGWARNTSDGKVEAIFEGEKEDVEQMIGFCRIGPTGARVSKVDVQWEEHTGEFRNFRILRSYRF
jgi:acylphosphatase